MSESRSDLALEAALQLAGPLVVFLLQEGVSYTRFSDALKASFLNAGETVLAAAGAKLNDSSLSTLSGVHRKDVRAWRQAGHSPRRSKILSPAMAVYARWVNDPAYCDSQGRPRVLERAGGAGSFEELAASVSKDVRPSALLRELQRLGVVQRVDAEGVGEKLKLCVNAFVPQEGSAEMLQLFSDNVGDHLAAAVNNLCAREPMLEQAVFAEGFSPEAVEALSALSRRIWQKGFREFVREAQKFNQNEVGRTDTDQRIRFGMYCYRGPTTKL